MPSIPSVVVDNAATNEPLGHPGFDRLKRFLAEVDHAGEIVAPGVPMPTVPLAAAAIGVDEQQIIKSVLFTGQEVAVLAVACGTRRIDRQALAEVVGAVKLKLADAGTVLALTGFPAGGVSPVGHATSIRVVIDTGVMELPEVYGGAGSEEALLKISPADIQRLTNATVARIVERSSE